MRVIAGTARRLQLKTLDGMDTRPTTDRIKETLFNMISAELYAVSYNTSPSPRDQRGSRMPSSA